MSAQAFAQQINKKIVDTTFVLDGKKVVVEQKLLKLEDTKGSFNQTLQSYMLKDAAGKVHFTREFPKAETREGEMGFMARFNISPAVISTPQKQALRISHGAVPSAPGSGVDYQLFVWQEDSLVALGDHFSIYGRFKGFSQNHEQIELSDSETVLMTQHIAYYFYADIPIVIDFDPLAKSTFRTVLDKDQESGLDIIPVTAERYPDLINEESTEITLFDSPDESSFSMVEVNPNSEIEIGSAYGTARMSENEGGRFSPEIYRLEITIDGKTGYIEEKDYMKIGLPAFG